MNDHSCWTEDFANRMRGLRAETTEDALLGRLVTDAVEMVRGAEMAGVSLQERRRNRTAASTSELVRRTDLAQFDALEGPSLEARKMHGPIVRSDGLGSEQRWPGFSSRAAELGVESMMSLPLHTETSLMGALNLYAGGTGAFDREAEGVALVLAAYGGTALEARRRETDLERGLGARGAIGQGIGILMERYKLTREVAFELLVSASQHNNVKVKHVADELASTGVLLRSPEGARMEEEARAPAG